MTGGILQQLGVQSKKDKASVLLREWKKNIFKKLGRLEDYKWCAELLEELQCNLVISTETLIFAHFFSCYRWTMLKNN